MTLRIDVVATDEVQRIVKRINEGDGTVAVAKFAINTSEQFVLVPVDSQDTAIFVSLFDAENACYVLRKNGAADLSVTWTLITWIPDATDAHQRLLYASAKHAFRKQFNSDRLVATVHFTTRSEIEEYLGGSGSGNGSGATASDNFLSNFERDLNSLKLTEAKSAVDRGVGAVTKTLSNLSMPLDSDLMNALKGWSVAVDSSSVNYLRIQIDLQSERMILKEKDSITISELPQRIPNDGACYHLFNFVHEHKSTTVNNCNVFIYSMAGYANCPLKHRMLYSTYKNFLVSQIEGYGITISKKLEIETGTEVTENCLRNELYPDEKAAVNVKKSFSKPATPSNRGPRRIIK